MDPAKLAAIFSERPALHRFPASNADRVQQLCQIIVSEYDGDAARDLGGRDQRRRAAPPCQGLARVSVSRRRRSSWLCSASSSGVRPPGWQEVSQPFGDTGTHFSVADITDAESLAAVRAHKSQTEGGSQGSQGGRHRLGLAPPRSGTT